MLMQPTRAPSRVVYVYCQPLTPIWTTSEPSLPEQICSRTRQEATVGRGIQTPRGGLGFPDLKIDGFYIMTYNNCSVVRSSDRTSTERITSGVAFVPRPISSPHAS